MVLRLPGDFNVFDFFFPTAEDNQVYTSQGNKMIPELRPQYKGEWATATEYIVDEIVYHEGAAYICVLANSGQEPPNTTYWEPLGESTYIIDEDYSTDPEYTETDSGARTAGVTVTGGVMILNSGDVDNGYCRIKGNKTITAAETQGSFAVEFRIKIDYSSHEDMEAYIGIGENGALYGDGSASGIWVYFNNEENLDDGFMAQTDSTGSGGGSGSWNIADNTYVIYRIEVLGSGGTKYYKNGNLLYTDTTNIPTDRDMLFAAKIYTRDNPSTEQKMYIDWLKVYKL